MAAQYRFLVLLLALVADGAPSWPVTYSYAPDNMPIIQVRLAPPRDQMPEVAASLAKLDDRRAKFETDKMLELEAAYSAEVERASATLPALVDRLMRAFEKPASLLAKRQTEKQQPSGSQAIAFREVHSTVGNLGQQTARINVLPVVAPDASVESDIENMESKRMKDEAIVFAQARKEMEGLTKIVENQVEAEVTLHANGILHALNFGLQAERDSVGFLHGSQPVRTSGLPLTTNVRVAASEEPFHTVAALAEDLERRRDASEDFVRTRLLELELKLLQAENEIVSASLGRWVERIAQASF